MTMEVLDGTEYRYAIEHPSEAFSDLDLQRMRPKKTPMGFPKVCVGGFAMVFELVGRDQTNNKELRRAVRCFKRLPGDLAVRYQEISKTLERISQESDFFLSTRYIEQGILLNDGWKPITTLQWVDGLALDQAFDEAHLDRIRMDRLIAQTRKLSLDFERWGIAHGDLQHGNMLVTAEGRIKLIDYDGMYVPGLRGQRANEAGHPDFRHPDRGIPERQADLFYPGLDRFALITIYLQTVAVALHPELWAQKKWTDGLLLREADYRDPDASEVLGAFRDFEDLRRPTDLFRRICRGSIEDVPRLNTFISETGIYVPKGADVPAAAPQARVPTSVPPAPVVSAQTTTKKKPRATPAAPTAARDWSRIRVVEASPADLGRHMRQEVVLVGEIEEVKATRVLGGARSLTLELKSMGREPVRVVIDEDLAADYGSLGDLRGLSAGTWIAARGRITFRLAWILTVGAEAIELIDRAEATRRARIWHRLPAAGVPPAPPGRPTTPSGKPPKVVVAKAVSPAKRPHPKQAAQKPTLRAVAGKPAQNAAMDTRVSNRVMGKPAPKAVITTPESTQSGPKQSAEIERWDALSQLLKIR